MGGGGAVRKVSGEWEENEPRGLTRTVECRGDDDGDIVLFVRGSLVVPRDL